MDRRIYCAVIGLAAILVTALLLSGCGDKVTLPNDLPKPDYTTGGIDTSYVQVNPIWTGAGGIEFDHPYDVFIGYDQFIYVCDTKNDRVVKLNVDGSFVESYPIINPVAITQDRGLDLLVVCGNYQVISGRDTTTYGNAVYRRSHFGDGTFQVAYRAPSPYYSVDIHGTTFWLEAEFWGIGASLTTDKEYFLADFGKGRVIRFDDQDQPVPPELVSYGQSVGQTQYPSDLYFYQIAGQNYLALAQGAPNLGVQIVSPINGHPYFENSGSGLPPLVRFAARGYKQVVVDEFSNFYVLVNAPDPLVGVPYMFYKFDRYGEPLLHFGTIGSGDRQFNNPRGMAYLNGILYIADTGNNRIIRYQLATDIQQ